METFAAYFSLNGAILLALSIMGLTLLLNLIRLLKGPHVVDRIIALDTLYVNSAAIIILVGLYVRETIFFEASLLIAMMGFVGTVALSKYVLRGDIIEE